MQNDLCNTPSNNEESEDNQSIRHFSESNDEVDLDTSDDSNKFAEGCENLNVKSKFLKGKNSEKMKKWR